MLRCCNCLYINVILMMSKFSYDIISSNATSAWWLGKHPHVHGSEHSTGIQKLEHLTSTFKQITGISLLKAFEAWKTFSLANRWQCEVHLKAGM